MSAKNVIFVSEEKLKAFTSINENTSVELLKPFIQIGQDIGLQTLLGTKFYNYLKDGIYNSTLTVEERLLIEDYIQPYLLHRAYYEALPNLWLRVMNKGLVVGSTEEGSSASIGEMRMLRNIEQDRYEFYSQRLMDFINNNQGDYPNYFNWSSTDGMKPSKENYFGGIHIQSGVRHLPNTYKYSGIDTFYKNCGDC
jgi:hypothetical protein